jgi:hypothetical protein
VKRFWWIVGIAALIAFVGACRSLLPTNRYLQPRSARESQSTAEARGKFHHGKHTAILEEQGIACVDCHVFNLPIEAEDESMARELSAHAMYPGSASCHFCHKPGPTHVSAAPSECTTCHENRAPLKPQNHDLAWMKVHSSMARAQPEQCESCHRQAQCINCHQRRDTIQTVVHERNFRFFHSVEARANPMSCGSCHRQDFCTNCHEKGKVGNIP